MRPEKTSSRTVFLLAFATLLLTIALAIAWVLGVTLFFPSGRLANSIVDRADLIRAHVDYLMMALFLFVFAVSFRQYSVVPPLWAIGASCYGALVNPLAFALRAFAPKVDPASLPEPHFPLAAAVSFSFTTIGFLASAGLVVAAAWRSRTS